MKSAPSFDSTPEFQHFTNIMRNLITVSKTELDELVRVSKDSSPRKNNPHSPGRKKTLKKR